MKTKITAALFDFDGVVADTEPQYDIFYSRLAADYRLGIADFAAQIKGTTFHYVLETYFGHLPAGEQHKIAEACRRYELQMDFKFVAGAREIIEYLQAHHYKTAVVTSSPSAKMHVALRKMGLHHTFDALITADHITEGKPHPMCYLLAAQTLHASPQQCVVFEDSIAGITAGKRAGMTVVGVATTVPAATLLQHTPAVMPDFSDLQQTLAYMA
jgi:HAD superfamily hydrolase (TIGR01509 family)